MGGVIIAGGFATLMLRLGGFNELGGRGMTMFGVGVRITGLICGGYNGLALVRRLVGTLIGGGFGVVKP